MKLVRIQLDEYTTMHINADEIVCVLRSASEFLDTSAEIRTRDNTSFKITEDEYDRIIKSFGG